MAKKKAVKYPQFMSLADFAKLVNRREDEVMTYVKSGVISEGYCYPAKFGDGKAIAFQPAKMLGFIEEATAVKPKAPPKEKPVPEKEEVEIKADDIGSLDEILSEEKPAPKEKPETKK